jgi:hypothetical protein
MGNNLYLCDGKSETVQILSLTTLERTVLLYTKGRETPLDVAVIPEDG